MNANPGLTTSILIPILIGLLIILAYGLAPSLEQVLSYQLSLPR